MRWCLHLFASDSACYAIDLVPSYSTNIRSARDDACRTPQGMLERVLGTLVDEEEGVIRAGVKVEEKTSRLTTVHKLEKL